MPCTSWQPVGTENLQPFQKISLNISWFWPNKFCKEMSKYLTSVPIISASLSAWQPNSEFIKSH